MLGDKGKMEGRGLGHTEDKRQGWAKKRGSSPLGCV